MHSHLGAQPGLDALFAEAVHAGRHRPSVLDDACRKEGREAHGQGAGGKAGGRWTGRTRQAERWVLAIVHAGVAMAAAMRDAGRVSEC
jgi:hypothetical protein